MGAALCVLVHVLGRPVGDRWLRGVTLLLEAQVFFFIFPAAGVSDHLNRGTGRPLAPSQLCDVEGVAGGHVGRHLRLEAMDVAAVAEQVALQWVAAVALFVV